MEETNTGEKKAGGKTPIKRPVPFHPVLDTLLRSSQQNHRKRAGGGGGAGGRRRGEG